MDLFNRAVDWLRFNRLQLRHVPIKPDIIVQDGTDYYFGYNMANRPFDVTKPQFAIKKVSQVATTYTFLWAESAAENLVFNSGANEYLTYNYS